MNRAEIYESVSVYVIATPQFSDLMYELNKHESGLRIAGVCSYGQTPNIPERGVDAVVCEYSNENLQQANLYITMLSNESIPFVTVCDSIKTGFELLNRGAAEMLALPPPPIQDAAKRTLAHSLFVKLRTAMRNKSVPDRVIKQVIERPINKIIAIGSSTGGTEAVFDIIKMLPTNSPPILIVQHMPPVFTKLYAGRLHKACAVSVWEAQNGDRLQHGLALIAPGDKHMELEKKGCEYTVRCYTSEKVSGHCPSVDVLFRSVANVAPKISIGVILTGMGSDGARGLTEMRRNGSFTIGQDKDSSIVYGMPRAAYEMGGVDVQEDLHNIPNVIISHIH